MLNKEEIKTALSLNHKDFCDYLSRLSEEEFQFSLNGEKWTAGQQLAHINKSVGALAPVFILPKFLIKLVFGKANRPSKGYDALVEKYHSKLEAGGKAPSQFLPPAVGFREREREEAKLNALVAKLNRYVSNLTEQEMDELIIPHPLLGKLTFREMMYFMMYHVVHHHEMTKINLGAMKN